MYRKQSYSAYPRYICTLIEDNYSTNLNVTVIELVEISINGLMNKSYFIYCPMEYLSAQKKTEVLLFKRKWMKVEIIMLSKIKHNYHVFSNIWNLGIFNENIKRNIMDLEEERRQEMRVKY